MMVNITICYLNLGGGYSGTYRWVSLLIPEKIVEYLADKHHVYLRGSGRLNFSSITEKNVEYTAEAIHETICKLNSKIKK